MLAGHYATALVAHQKFPKGTLLFFLIASQLQDLLWFILHYLGLERTEPSDVFDTTLSNMTVDMLYTQCSSFCKFICFDFSILEFRKQTNPIQPINHKEVVICNCPRYSLFTM